MKKIVLILFLLLINLSFVSADSDFVNDYTLIDCVNWNNDSWIAFDSNMPFATLKVGIENTINYINSNVNKGWNEETASWIIFNIKVECSFNDILNQSISLNYNWVAYNNELIIEWINENSLIFKEVDFKLWSNAWNISFKNAQFLNDNKPYFYDKINRANTVWYNKSTHPSSNWIKILDSYIQLKNWNNLWDNMRYQSYKYYYQGFLRQDYKFNYSNKQIIENSILDIDIDNNFNFKMPVFLKNSKINFRNTTWTGIFNISFLEDWNKNTNKDLNFSVLVSNEIDLWWNNFSAENTTNISFLNNKFTNLNNFNFWGVWLYVNNFIENNSSINITNFHNLYNNVLKSGFTDSYDIFNYRKNFALENIWSKWFGWIYNRLRANKYFNINVDSASLYKEITGQDLLGGLWDIYLIFNY